MANLYRVVSKREWDNYQKTQLLSIAENTLEAKQFFKSRKAVLDFFKSSKEQNYTPPYVSLLVFQVDDSKFKKILYDSMLLDGYEAISIPENQLAAFNKIVTFVKEETL